MAQSDFIGAPNRWLNPLDGAVDLDGDGSREIAVIETLHIAPTLRVHQWNGGQLDTLARIPLGATATTPLALCSWRAACSARRMPRAGTGADPARRWWPGRGVYL